MSKPYRDASSGAGLDVVVTLPPAAEMHRRSVEPDPDRQAVRAVV